MKACFLLGTLLLGSSALRASLVTDGAFDVGAWTFTNGASYNTTGENPASGGFAVLNDSPGVEPEVHQTIAGLVAGHLYRLTFDMISVYQCCASDTTAGVRVSIAGASWEYIVPNTQNTWQAYIETFTYTGGPNVLSFAAQVNGTDTDAGLDNVALTDLSSAVPEPVSLLLCGGGLLLLGRLRRR